MRNIACFFPNVWVQAPLIQRTGGIFWHGKFREISGTSSGQQSGPKTETARKHAQIEIRKCFTLFYCPSVAATLFGAFALVCQWPAQNIFMTCPTFLFYNHDWNSGPWRGWIFIWNSRQDTSGMWQPRWLVEMHTRCDLLHVGTHGAHQPTNETQQSVSVASRNTLGVPWGVSLPQETPWGVSSHQETPWGVSLPQETPLA